VSVTPKSDSEKLEGSKIEIEFEITEKLSEGYPENWHVLDFSKVEASEDKKATYSDGYFVINSENNTEKAGTIKSNNVTVTDDNINKLGWDIGTKAQNVYQTNGTATGKSQPYRTINFTISSNVKVTVGAIAGGTGRTVGTQKKGVNTDDIDDAVDVSTSNLGEYVFYLDASESTDYVIASGASIMICYVVVEEDYEISEPIAKPDGTSAVKANTKVALSSSPEDGTDINIYWTYEDTLTKEGTKYKATDKYNAETNQPEITEEHKKVIAVAVLEDAEGNIRKESTPKTFNYEITDGPVAEEINIVTPTATVNSGIYSDTQTVSLSSDTKASDGTAVDVDIYYTTDGTNPKTSTTKTKYTTGSTISVDKTMTIKAYATKDATEESEDINTYKDSSIATYRYIIKTNATKKYELLVAGEDEKVVPSEGQTGFGDDVVLGTDGYYNAVSAAGKSVIGTVSTIKGTVNGVKDTLNYNIETLRATWPEEAGVLDATTKAVTLTGGKMQDGSGTQVVNAIKIFVSASEKASVTVYYACKTPASDSFDGATLDVYKSNSFDDTSLGTKVSGITTAKSTSAAVSKAEFDLTEAGVYYIGFSADGGIIPYIEVVENPSGSSDNEPTSVDAPTLDPAPNASGSYEFEITPGEVKITPNTTGSQIKYVTDKDTGFETITADDIYSGGHDYTAPISITEATTIKAIAYYTRTDSTVLKSGIVTCAYTIKADAVRALDKPTATPASGAVEENSYVKLNLPTIPSDLANAKIFYTTDGTTEPATAEGGETKLYDTTGNGIQISAATTIKAIVATFDNTDTTKVTGKSQVETFTYSIKGATPTVAAFKTGDEPKLNKTTTPHPGDTLTVSYKLDVPNEVQDKSTIEWFTVSGSTETAISSNISNDGKSYTVQAADKDKMIRVKVTPKAEGYTDGTLVAVTSAKVEEKVTPGEGKGLEIILGEKEYTYTGSAIVPEFYVQYDGNDLIEGVDYTYKCSNNVKVSTKNPAKITVTGKGNLSGKTVAEYTINPKSLSKEDTTGDTKSVEGDVLVAVSGTKAALPTLTYNGIKLTNKDIKFNESDVSKNYKWADTDDGKEITIEAGTSGAFKDSRTVTVKLITAADKKNAQIKKVALSPTSGIYNEAAHAPEVTVTVKGGATTVTAESGDGLKEDTDYVVSYPADMKSAGKKKITVTGISDKCFGTKTVTYTVKPAAKNGSFKVSVNNSEDISLPFNSTGVTFDQDALKVTYLAAETDSVESDILVYGKDYKISYSKNKQTAASAKATISGLGNYKGVKTVVEFTITKTDFADCVEVIVPDKVFTKASAFKSTPYVIEKSSNTVLKSSNYKVTYSTTEDGEAIKTLPADQDTVWVKIEPKNAKSNFTGSVSKSYSIRYSSEGSSAVDLSKAKISFFAKKEDSKASSKVEYTGEEVTPYSMVIKGKGIEDITVILDKEAEGYDATKVEELGIEIVNNKNKGKATVILAPKGSAYAGGKTATFSIVAKKLTLEDFIKPGSNE
ncbi:MAG: chitobiase/beta-hexosaminidase C-terminal domain-containing protein, partial [Lachnospiraceae bacterium]|nr:chitobiase/beta-hexosaminidase C-terminal domain-containing protein [Lachnospiraceae bacterium]